MTESAAPLNPVDIEQSIRETANDIARGVWVVSNAESKAREAHRVYDRAFAAAYLAAERTAKALEAKLRAFQSVGASVRQMFAGQMSGVGS